MKKIQNLLSTLLLSLLFLCFFQKADAQCDRNQYNVGLSLYTDNQSNNGNAIVKIELDKAITTFNRVDFDIQGPIDLFPLTINFGNGITKVINAPIKETQNYTALATMNTKISVITATGQSVETNFTVRILTEPYEAPDAVWDISNNYNITCSGCSADANGGLAKAYIKYANPDKKLRKVVVFVEGIDFGRDSITDPNNGCKAMRYGDFGWDVFYMGHKADTSWDFVRLMPQTRQAVQAKGYDMVLLDFRNGADYMQANGEFLIKLLKKTYIL